LNSNDGLRAEAEKAQAGTSPGTPANTVAFAVSRGYAFTIDELKAYAKPKASAAGKDLTDAELEGVVGGTYDPTGLRNAAHTPYPPSADGHY
jgi:hypothetical protein